MVKSKAHRSPDELKASQIENMSSLTPGQPQNTPHATFPLDLASNKTLLLVLQAGTAAQARRHQRSASSTPTQGLVPPPSIDLQSFKPPSPSQAVSDGYQSSDDSLHIPSSSSRQRHARANVPFLPPLPGHSAVHEAAVSFPTQGFLEIVAAPAADAISSSKQGRRNSSSSIPSTFSWQESIFHVRRLSDAYNSQVCAPVAP